MTKRSLIAVLALAALPVAALGQKAVSEGDGVEVTSKIIALDRSARAVTVRIQDGDVTTIFCGPEVQRYDELKVGDTVTFRYYESVVYQIRKPGQPGGEPAGNAPQIVRGTGARPSGTLSRQLTARVVVQAIDPKGRTVTVASQDGQVTSYKVDDKRYLEGLQVGDTAEITYTQALMISVK